MASIDNINCYNLFKLKKMLFIQSKLLEGLRLIFKQTLSQGNLKYKKIQYNSFETEISIGELSSIFKGLFV